ncbi:MAG: sulfotransferase domain-containing protein [Bacteroidota bacterium]
MYTNEHRKGINHNYRKFIVLTYRRSGANYFLELLRSHHQIVAFANLYEKNKLGFIYPGYPRFDCKKTLEYRDKKPVDFLNKIIFGNYHENIRTVGFKIIYEIDQPAVLDYLRSMPDLKVIILQRQNLLRVHLSDMIAKSTNKWHALLKEHEGWVKESGLDSRIRVIENKSDPILPPDFKIELDYNKCLDEFLYITRLTEKFDAFFNPANTLALKYENILDDQTKETKKVLDFLGADEQLLTSRLIRINNRPLHDVISNYADLKEKFKGSAWEKFFEE